MSDHPRVSEVQRAILGLAMLAPAAAGAVCDRLRDDQLDPPASHVLAAIRQLTLDGTYPEPVTVTGVLHDRGQLEAAGGRAAIEALTLHAAQIGSIDALCLELVTAATWRDRTRAAAAAAAAANVGDEQAWADAIAQAEADEGATGLQVVTAQEWASSMYDHLDAGEGVPDDVIATPWPALNMGLNGGLWPGELVVVLGYSNHGKSICANDLAHHAATGGHRAHMYLTEDHGTGRGARTLSRVTGVPSWRIMQRRLKPDQHAAVVAGLARMPYGYTPVAGRTAQEICAHIRRSKWDLAIIDHLHDLAYTDERDLTGMVRAFRAEANRGRTCIVLCAQPNSSMATSGGTARLRAPAAHSVKGAGSVRDAANTMLIVHQEQQDDGTPTGDGTIRAAKTRTGHYPSVEVVLNDRYTSFAPGLETAA